MFQKIGRLFTGISRDPENTLPGLEPGDSVDSLLARDFLVIFKHSPSCQISWFAHAQVMRFRAAHPEVPIRMVLVQQDAAASREIALRTGVRHASPQILVIREGTVIANTSHEGITADALEELTSGLASHPESSQSA